MKRFASILATLALFAASGCGSGYTLAPENDPDEYSGTWLLSIGGYGGCPGGMGLKFQITLDGTTRVTDKSFDIEGKWWLHSFTPQPVRPLTGHVDLERKTFVLKFRTADGSEGTFTGTDPERSRLDGTFSDPARAIPNEFGNAGCAGSAGAAKLYVI